MTVFPIIFNEIMRSDFRTFAYSIRKSCLFRLCGSSVLQTNDQAEVLPHMNLEQFEEVEIEIF